MRLLIVRLSSMGDVIHALPLAESAHTAGAVVGWLVERPFAELLEGNPHCAEVFAADTRRWRSRLLEGPTWREIGALRRRLRAFAPDCAIDVQGLWKSAVAARAAGSPVVGFAARARREPTSALLASRRVVPRAQDAHVVDQNLALLSAGGLPVKTRGPDAGYLLSRPSSAAETFLSSLPHPYAVYHPGTAQGEKAWGEERFAPLARALANKRGLHAVISWGPGDEARCERLRALLPEASIPPLLDFPGLARLLRGGALCVAGDTGPLHLADALGGRTLALFGPTDAARTGPYRDRRGVVTRMHDVSDEEVLERALRLVMTHDPQPPL